LASASVVPGHVAYRQADFQSEQCKNTPGVMAFTVTPKILARIGSHVLAPFPESNQQYIPTELRESRKSVDAAYCNGTANSPQNGY
jgi:hypothetical protein